MRNIRFNKIKKFLPGGAIGVQSPSLYDSLYNPNLSMYFRDPNKIWGTDPNNPLNLGVDNQLNQTLSLLTFGENSNDLYRREAAKQLKDQRDQYLNQQPTTSDPVAKNFKVDTPNTDINIESLRQNAIISDLSQEQAKPIISNQQDKQTQLTQPNQKPFTAPEYDPTKPNIPSQTRSQSYLDPEVKEAMDQGFINYKISPDDSADLGLSSTTNKNYLLKGLNAQNINPGQEVQFTKKENNPTELLLNTLHNQKQEQIMDATTKAVTAQMPQTYQVDERFQTQSEDQDSSSGNRVVTGGGGSNDKPKISEDLLKAEGQHSANMAKYINAGLDLGQSIMYSVGANSNDSKGTSVARGVVATGAEITSKLPPPANIAAPILKGLNLADSILDKAHVGKYNDKFSMDNYTFEQIGGSYGSSLNAANEASRLSEQRHGFLGIGGRKARNRDNAKIAEAKRQQSIMASIANANSDLKNGAEAMSDINHIQNSIFLNGGYDANYARAAKEGGTLKIMSFDDYLNIPEVPSFEDYLAVKELPSFDEYLNNIQQFRNGGNITSPNNIKSDENVIPEGALHKNKHNLKQTGYDDSDITKKGIPVIDNDGNQQAEIELNEIIFSLEVTQFLEENYKKYYSEETKEKEKDELALKTGKELVYQILQNTIDNTGLIQSAKNGGVLSFQGGGSTLFDDSDVIDQFALYKGYPDLLINDYLELGKQLNIPTNILYGMLARDMMESNEGQSNQANFNLGNIHVPKKLKQEGKVKKGRDKTSEGKVYDTSFKEYDTLQEYLQDAYNTQNIVYGVKGDESIDDFFNILCGANPNGFSWGVGKHYKESLYSKLADLRKRKYITD